jgi:heat shock gene repressor HrcA
MVSTRTVRVLTTAEPGRIGDRQPAADPRPRAEPRPYAAPGLRFGWGSGVRHGATTTPHHRFAGRAIGRILRAVIDEYVTSATPVSSGSLVSNYPLGVSSATVRNILSDLEALGLLTHPHTSAGRVPTDAGYRYYVQVLADEWSLPQVEQRMIRHQFGQVEFASEHWFRLAASTLAANTGTAGLATTAKPQSARVRRVDLVAVQDRLALLVVLFRKGR